MTLIEYNLSHDTNKKEQEQLLSLTFRRHSTMRCNRFDDLLGSCRQGEGAPDNVEHVERPDSISWECDTQQDAPRPRGAPCPSCFHPCLLSRSGKSRSRNNPLKQFFLFSLFSGLFSSYENRRNN